MIKEGLFAFAPLWKKLLVMLFIVLTGLFLTMFIFGISLQIFPDEPINAFHLRFVQVLQSFLVFIFPALLLATWFSFSPKDYLYMEQKNKLPICLLTVFVGISMLPFINWLTFLNEQISFPESFSWLENRLMESEKMNNESMEMLLQMNSPAVFLFNLFLVGILTAIAEEFFFRGILQHLFIDYFKNAHLGIWLSAFVFSSIHMQFYGFFPRMLLGAYLGYLLWWSKSIWLPVLAHFINNAIAVTISYLEQQHLIEPGFDTMGAHGETHIAVISFVLSTIILFFIYSQRIKNDTLKKQTPEQ